MRLRTLPTLDRVQLAKLAPQHIQASLKQKREQGLYRLPRVLYRSSLRCRR